MTNKEAIEIFEKYLKCAEETCCIMDCFNCGYDIDDNQIYCAIEVAIKALKTTGEDLICRQDAIDALSHMCSEDENGITVSRANTNSMLRALPSAQPEIIHCRDCKHHWTHSCMDAFPREICDLDQTFYDSNFDYCSLAERRTDE